MGLVWSRLQLLPKKRPWELSQGCLAIGQVRLRSPVQIRAAPPQFCSKKWTFALIQNSFVRTRWPDEKPACASRSIASPSTFPETLGAAGLWRWTVGQREDCFDELAGLRYHGPVTRFNDFHRAVQILL